jgi:hypothetical protein
MKRDKPISCAKGKIIYNPTIENLSLAINNAKDALIVSDKQRRTFGKVFSNYLFNSDGH